MTCANEGMRDNETLRLTTLTTLTSRRRRVTHAATRKIHHPADCGQSSLFEELVATSAVSQRNARLVRAGRPAACGRDDTEDQLCFPSQLVGSVFSA